MLHDYSFSQMIKTGVYKITCLSNNKIYVGSAVAFKCSNSKKGFLGRLNTHIRTLNLNKHHNKPLQNAWNKYGEDNFKFEILVFCEPYLCKNIEQHYLDTLKPYDNIGFNICRNSLSNNIKIIKSSNTNKNRDLKNLNKHQRKVVLQFDKNNNFIQEWTGISHVARTLNICRTNIYKCCRGTEKSTGGFIWKYKDPNFIVIKQPKFKIKIINILTNEIIIHSSFKTASIFLKCCVSTIRLYYTNNLLFENKYKIEKIIL